MLFKIQTQNRLENLSYNQLNILMYILYILMK